MVAVTIRTKQSSFGDMKRRVKALFAILLVAFAAATVVQSAQVTAMGIVMSMDGGQCDGCNLEPGGEGVTCASACIVPVSGMTVPPVGLVKPVFNVVPRLTRSRSMAGWQAPPKPYPPRAVLRR